MAQEGLGAGRRRNELAACSRGGVAPEKTELGLNGADSNGGWVGRHLRGMRKPLVASGGGFEASSVKLVRDGGSVAQGSPSFGSLAKLGSKEGGFGSGMFSVPRRTWLGPWQDTLSGSGHECGGAGG